MRSLVLALVMLAVLPAAAGAACTSSTPSSATFADSVADGEFGLAPEILSVVATSDAACRITVQDVLADAFGPGDLIDGDAVGIYLDTDGNPATGSALWEGADRVVIIVGRTGPDLPPGLGVWDGATFSFAGATSLPAAGAGGFAATPDQLGMTAPANVGIRTGTLWAGVFDTYFDFAPEPFASSFRFPVAFSTAAPPAPPPPPAPPVSTPPVARPAGCTVPRVKRLRSPTARRRLRNAGCRYRIVRVRSRLGAGRVVSTTPAAGRRTTRTVVIRVSRGPARGAMAAVAPASARAAAERELSRQVSHGSGD
jgi:PASTA domain-containing protein